ncbi:RES domain-containing protein [Azotobacter vinelandii]|nr:RES domain-containing protein [Azotobacter vinelandii]
MHKGFRALDSVPHVLTAARILDPVQVYSVDSKELPNPNWLIPGTPSLDQQRFGDELLARHPFILIPSTVSRHSWNIVMNPSLAEGLYELVLQERFALDTRLNPPHQ